MNYVIGFSVVLPSGYREVYLIPECKYYTKAEMDKNVEVMRHSNPGVEFAVSHSGGNAWFFV